MEGWKNVIRIAAARARVETRSARGDEEEEEEEEVEEEGERVAGAGAGRAKGETNKSTIGNYACISDERALADWARRGRRSRGRGRARVPEERRTVKIRPP